MLPVEFAAQRRERLTRADDELHPIVETALGKYENGEAGWKEEILDAAAQLWIEHFEAQAPGRSFTRPLARFRTRLDESLDKTATPEGGVTEGQVDRVTHWLSSMTVNDGTITGAFGRGITHKRWITMHDSSVRDIHDAVDGQTVPIGGAFNVAGSKLGYPGEPVGPPEVWINCRCIAQPAARSGETMSLSTHTMGPEDATEDENPDVVLSNNAFAEDEIPPGEREEDDLPADLVDEEEDGEEVITEIPVHGIAAPEGVFTGDGRQFAVGSLSNRDLPLPLLYQPVSTDGHDQAYTVGRLDEIWRDDANMIRYKGALIVAREFANEVIGGIIDATIRGVSVDVDDVELDLSHEEELMKRAEDGDEEAMRELMGMDGKMPKTIFSKARISGLTIVSIPAFQEAYIALGDEFEEDQAEEAPALTACGCVKADEGMSFDAVTYAPGTKDGPGWITHPVPTARIRRYWTKGEGAAKIGWGTPGDFNRCRAQLAKYIANPDWLAGTCANLHKEALGFWPAQHHAVDAIAASAARAPIVILASAAGKTKPYPRSWFAEPEMDGARPLKIEKDTRRIYGYLAEWGTCHLGVDGLCTAPPEDETDYAYFLKGVVDTDEGEQAVGTLTYGIGHASERMRAAAATAHYDQTDAVRAYVNVGENAHGIWFAGVLAPWVTDQDIEAMRAIGSLSGDWRDPRGGWKLDLIGAVFVNTPAFALRAKVVASAGRQVALIGAGRLMPERTLRASGARMTAEEVAGITRTAIAEYRHQEKVAAALEPAREKVKQRRLAAAREKVGSH